MGNGQTTSGSRQPRPSIAAVLLGLFVVGELVYMPLASVIKKVPVRMAVESGEFQDNTQARGTYTPVGPAQAVLDAVGIGTCRWGELTGHTQIWGMFAHPLPEYSGFVATEFVHADGSRGELPSRFEPADPDDYFRWPGPHTRVYNVEWRFVAWPTRLAVHPDPAVWPRACRELVSHQHRSMRAFLNQRLGEYREQRPDAPPVTEAILKIRLVRTVPVGDPPASRGPRLDVPVARWLPGQPVEPGRLPVEAFDPVTQTFVPVSPEG